MATISSVTWSILFLHFLTSYIDVSLASNFQSGYFNILQNIEPGNETRNSTLNARSIIHCASACVQESRKGICTVALFSRLSKVCTLTASNLSSLFNTNSSDTVALYSRNECDIKSLQPLPDGYYTQSSFSGGFQAECYTGFQLTTSSQPNLFLCDVDGNWVDINRSYSCFDHDLMRYIDGRTFVTAFMNNYGFPDVKLYLYIIPYFYDNIQMFSYVSITAPSASYDQTFMLTDPLIVEIPVSAIDDRMDISIYNAITVRSTTSIQVYALNINGNSTGGFTVLPVHSLSKRYMVAASPFPDVYSRFMLIAYEGANVDITYPDKTTDKITLEAGETYQVSRYNVSGTFVESDKEIAVLGGELCANLPDGANDSCDHAIEQMPPIEALDTLYVLPEMKLRSSFILHIVASDDNTIVTIRDRHAISLYDTNLNKGDTFSRTFQNGLAISVEADRPVLVTQYGISPTQSETSVFIYGDSSMFVVPGVNHFLLDYRFYVPDEFTNAKVMMIFNTTNDMSQLNPYRPQDGLLHNGMPIYTHHMDTAVSVNYGGMDQTFTVVYLDVTPGVHSLQHANLTFGAILYGQKLHNEFAWNLGMYLWERG